MKDWATLGVYVYSSERKQWTLVFVGGKHD